MEAFSAEQMKHLFLCSFSIFSLMFLNSANLSMMIAAIIFVKRMSKNAQWIVSEKNLP
jgi:hypothetical protein